jgi:hypothetical protein
MKPTVDMEDIVPPTMQDTYDEWTEQLETYEQLASYQGLGKTPATAAINSMLHKLPTLWNILKEANDDEVQDWAARQLDTTHEALGAYTSLLDNADDLYRREVHQPLREESVDTIAENPEQYAMDLVRERVGIPEKPLSKQDTPTTSERELATIYTLLDEGQDIEPEDSVTLLDAFYNGSLEQLLYDNRPIEPITPDTRAHDLLEEDYVDRLNEPATNVPETGPAPIPDAYN